MSQPEEFSDLSAAAKLALAVAMLLALAGLLAGLAGLLLCGILLFDALFPGANGGGADDMVAVAGNFAVMAVITVLGFLNLAMVLRWEAFLDGGWKRYLVQSTLCALAAVFLLTSVADAFLSP